MPPGRAGFDGEPDVGPGDVEVDRLAVAQHQRMLPVRRGQADVVERLEQTSLEVALGRSILRQ